MPTVSITVKVKKACNISIQCEACNHLYQMNTYIKDSATETYDGYANKGAEATQTAKRAAIRGIEKQTQQLLSGDYAMIIDKVPCPQCGYTQSWMIQNSRGIGLKTILYSIGWFVACMVFAWILESMAGAGGEGAYEMMSLIGGIPAAIGIAVGVWFYFDEPNRNWKKNPVNLSRPAPSPRKPLKALVGDLEFGE